MSNISNTTWQALTKNLFPDLTYRNNSGGEPKDITNLTHDYLKGFHQKFYHPSNATYFTWGDVDAKEIQKFIDDKLAKPVSYTHLPSPRDRTRSRMPSSA